MVSIWNWFLLILDFYVFNYFGKNFDWRSGLHQAPTKFRSEKQPFPASLLEKFGTHSFKFLRQVPGRWKVTSYSQKMSNTHKNTGKTRWDQSCTEVVFECKVCTLENNTNLNSICCLIKSSNIYFILLPAFYLIYVWNIKCR